MSRRKSPDYPTILEVFDIGEFDGSKSMGRFGYCSFCGELATWMHCRVFDQSVYGASDRARMYAYCEAHAAPYPKHVVAAQPVPVAS